MTLARLHFTGCALGVLFLAACGGTTSAAETVTPQPGATPASATRPAIRSGADGYGFAETPMTGTANLIVDLAVAGLRGAHLDSLGPIPLVDESEDRPPGEEDGDCRGEPGPELVELCSSLDDLTILGVQFDLALIMREPPDMRTSRLPEPNAIAAHLFLSESGLGAVAVRAMILNRPSLPELPAWLASSRAVGAQLRHGLIDDPDSVLVQPGQARDSRIAVQFAAARPSDEDLRKAALVARGGESPIAYDRDDIFVYLRTGQGALYTIRVYYGTTEDGAVGLRRRVRARPIP